MRKQLEGCQSAVRKQGSCEIATVQTAHFVHTHNISQETETEWSQRKIWENASGATAENEEGRGSQHLSTSLNLVFVRGCSTIGCGCSWILSGSIWNRLSWTKRCRRTRTDLALSRTENRQEASEDLRKAERFSEHLEATFLRRSKSIENSREFQIQDDSKWVKMLQGAVWDARAAEQVERMRSPKIQVVRWWREVTWTRGLWTSWTPWTP